MANDKDFKVKNNLNVQGGTIYLDEGSEAVKLVGNSNLDLYSDNLIRFYESDSNTLRATFDLNDNKFQFGSSSSSITDSQTHTVAISGGNGLKVSGTGYFGGSVQLLGAIHGQAAGLGSSGSNISILRNVLLTPTSEDGAAIDPLKINDMAGVTYWGEISDVSGFYKTRAGTSGSYTYSNAVAASDAGWPSAFDGTSSTAGSWYTDDGVDGATQGTGTFIVDFDDQKVVTWTANVGIVFGSAGFTAEKIKIECYRDGAWQTECDISNNTDIAVVRRVANNNGSGVTKVRYTIGSAVGGSYFRIHSCFITGNAAGHHGTLANSGVFYLPKYGDAYQHGSFIPSLNNTYNIGNATYKHQTIYAMNLDAATSIKTGGVTRIDSSGNLTNVQGSFLGLSGGTLTGQLTLGATTSNNVLFLDSASNKSSYTAYTSGSSGFSIGIPDETQNKLVISSGENLSGNHLFTLDSTGAITIAPPALAGLQDGLILYDRTAGNGNGLKIRWKSGTDPDTAELYGSSFDELYVKTGGADRGKFGTAGLYLNNGLQVDSTTSSSSTGGVNFTITDDVADQAFIGVQIDHNISGSQAINAGEDYNHIGLMIDQDSSSTHTGTDPTADEHRTYGLYVDSRGGGVSDLRRGVYSYVESQHSSGQVSELTGGHFSAVADELDTGKTSNVHGVYGLAQGYATGTGGASNFYGGYFKSILTTAHKKATTNVTGIYADVEIDDPSEATTVDSLRAFWGEIDNDDTGDNRTITNSYLFYGNYIGDLPATNNYGVFIADDVRSYFSGSITTKAGTEAVPSFSFNGDTDTGMWKPAANTIAFSTNGGERVRIASTGSLGIGTNNPTNHINTGSFFKPDSSGKFLTLNGGANGSFIMLESSTTTDGDQIGGIYWNRTQGQGDAHKQVAGIDVIQDTYAPNNTLEGGTLRFFTKPSGSGTNTSRMVITGSGNVGIGITAPTDKLDVAGALRLTANISFDSNKSGRIYKASNHGLAFHGVTGTENDFAMFTPAGQLMVTNPTGTNNVALIPTASGNVGIGTASPDAKLRIDQDVGTVGLKVTGGSGGVSIAEFIRDVGGTTSVAISGESARPQMKFTSAGNTFALGVNSNTFEIADNAVLGTNTRFSITNAGNVGIGTSTPVAKLHVQGSLSNSTGNATSQVQMRDRAVFSIKPVTDNSGTLHFAQVDSGNSIGMQFTNSAANATWDLSLQPFAGNVGIGTTAPASKLHVRDGDLLIQKGTGTTSVSELGFTNAFDTAFLRSSYTNPSATTETYLAFHTNTSGATNGTVAEQMRIVGNKVGIGTTAPSYKLDVSGTGDIVQYISNANPSGLNGRTLLIRDNHASSSQNSKISYAATSSPGQDVYLGKRTTSNAGFFHLTNSSGTEHLTVDMASGKVGIGTTSPTAKLQISHNGGHTSGNVALTHSTLDLYNPLAANTNEKGSVLTFSDNYFGGGTSYPRTTRAAIKGGTDTVGNTADGFLAFYTDDGAANSMPERMRITKDGNVGIATNAPGAKLHVAGAIVSEGGSFTSGIETASDAGLVLQRNDYIYSDDNNYLRRIIGHTSTGLIEIGQGGTSLITDIILKPGSTGNVRFFASGSEDVRINASGNVGIGTSDPQAQLQIKQLGINVNQSSVSSTSQYTCDSMSATIFRSARYTIQITNVTDSTYHLTEMLLIHDGTTPSISEFGTIFTGSAAEAVFTADISSGNVRLLATPASTDNMQFKVVRHSILV